MTYSMKYPPQGTSQNKQRLREFLEQKEISLDAVKVQYMPHFPQHHGELDYGPKIVSFDDLPNDIRRCTVLVDGELTWGVEIGTSELTAHPPKAT